MRTRNPAWFHAGVSFGAQFLRYWLPALLWVMLMFSASTSAGSGERTSRIINPILRWLIPDISHETLVGVHVAVRKAAHVTEYAVLATLLLRALRKPARGHSPPWRWNQALLTLILGVAVASADESFQRLWVERLGSIMDVFIDSAGVLIGLTIYWLAGRRARRW